MGIIISLNNYTITEIRMNSIVNTILMHIKIIIIKMMMILMMIMIIIKRIYIIPRQINSKIKNL